MPSADYMTNKINWKVLTEKGFKTVGCCPNYLASFLQFRAFYKNSKIKKMKWI